METGLDFIVQVLVGGAISPYFLEIGVFLLKKYKLLH
jgi:hypothetical protein